MAKKYVRYDDTTAKFETAPTPGSPVDQDYDVASPTSNFVVTTTFSTGLIDVYVNGWLKREGATFDFVRNTGLNRIEFNSPVVTGAWVRIRIY
jgi:hypothetical protein